MHKKVAHENQKKTKTFDVKTTLVRKKTRLKGENIFNVLHEADLFEFLKSTVY